MYPTITPLVSEKWELFYFLAVCTYIQMVEGLFNSQIHAGGCFSNTKKNLGVLWVWEGSQVLFQGADDLMYTYMVFTDKFTL